MSPGTPSVTTYASNKPAPAGYNAKAFHLRAVDRGVNIGLYVVLRVLLQPIFHVFFRLRRVGLEHVPRHGPVIFAANHRSFLDPFVIGTLMRRPVYYVAKKELFLHPVSGWLLSRLGAFPIDRGAGDQQAMETARQILARGDCVVIFPEGTRTRPGPLGHAHRGVGRLALQTGAPVVPVAVLGTEAVRRGLWIRPHRVSVRCGSPLRYPQLENPSPARAGAVTERIWARVVVQWDWLGGAMPEPAYAPTRVERLQPHAA
jgi:glycerol-3-phosphate dehydrogenase (NAD(P)+)